MIYVPLGNISKILLDRDSTRAEGGNLQDSMSTSTAVEYDTSYYYCTVLYPGFRPPKPSEVVVSPVVQEE